MRVAPSKGLRLMVSTSPHDQRHLADYIPHRLDNAQGKHHTQALLCLARRRADVLFAMLRDGTFYEPQPSATVT